MQEKVNVELSGEKKFRQTFSNGHFKAWSIYIYPILRFI
uniref:Uncharacterized protein n=1 Tax=Arundo donax TaxID=35708 RepID=A0A0A9B478_ARUDO